MESTATDDLMQGDVGRIAQIAGLEAALKIAVAFRGTTIYINSLDPLFREARNARIRKDYDGGTPTRRLAIKYGLTIRGVRKILGTTGAAIDSGLIELIQRYGGPGTLP